MEPGGGVDGELDDGVDIAAIHALTVPEDCSGQRLDRVLAALLPQISRSKLQRLVTDGRVFIAENGPPARCS